MNRPTAYSLIALALLPCAAFSQCKYEMNEFDKFEKIHRVETKARIRIYSLGTDYLFFRRSGDGYYLDISTAIPSGTGGIMADDEILFMLADESVISFRSVKYALPRMVMVGNSISQRLDCTFEADRDRFQALAEQSLIAIRFKFGSTYDDVRINANAAQEKVRVAAQCLLAAVPSTP